MSMNDRDQSPSEEDFVILETGETCRSLDPQICNTFSEQEIEKLKQTCNKSEQDIEKYKAEIARLEAQNDRSLQENQKLVSEIALMNEEIKHLKQQVLSPVNSVATTGCDNALSNDFGLTLAAEADNLLSKNVKATAQVSNKVETENSLMALKEELQSVSKARDNLEKLLDQEQRRNEKLLTEKQELEANCRIHVNNIDMLEKNYKNLQASYDTLRDNTKNMDKFKDSMAPEKILTKQLEMLKKELDEARATIHEKTMRIKELDGDLVEALDDKQAAEKEIQKQLKTIESLQGDMGALKIQAEMFQKDFHEEYKQKTHLSIQLENLKKLSDQRRQQNDY